jgi:hypothetical protein
MAGEHPHHQVHPQVPAAWPEAAQGGLATCAGGFIVA